MTDKDKFLCTKEGTVFNVSNIKDPEKRKKLEEFLKEKGFKLEETKPKEEGK